MNKRYNVSEIMGATKRYAAQSGRIPNIEYCMLGGVNDSDSQARQFVELMRGFRAHVNLIPYNSIGTGLSGAEYTQPSPERLDAFISILRNGGVNTHFRKRAAMMSMRRAGQLREIGLPVRH